MLQVVCSSLPTLNHEWGYTQPVRGLLGSEARRVGSRGTRALWASSPAYASLLEGTLQRGSLHQRSSRWIWWREWRWVSPYLLPHPPDPTPALWDQKPILRFLPPGGTGSTLHLSSSEEVDVESIEEDSPPQSPQYEEMLEVGGYLRGSQGKHLLACRKTGWTTEKQARWTLYAN